jgi:hypothetical protein
LLCPLQQTAGGANLNNLAKLMSNNPRAEKLRKIVITGKIPATFVPGLPREVATKGEIPFLFSFRRIIFILLVILQVLTFWFNSKWYF